MIQEQLFNIISDKYKPSRALTLVYFLKLSNSLSSVVNMCEGHMQSKDLHSNGVDVLLTTILKHLVSCFDNSFSSALCNKFGTPLNRCRAQAIF